MPYGIKTKHRGHRPDNRLLSRRFLLRRKKVWSFSIKTAPNVMGSMRWAPNRALPCCMTSIIRAIIRIWLFTGQCRAVCPSITGGLAICCRNGMSAGSKQSLLLPIFVNCSGPTALNIKNIRCDLTGIYIVMYPACDGDAYGPGPKGLLHYKGY